MEARIPVYKDSTNLFHIYSDGNDNPDTYTIWINGHTDVVTRQPGESADTFFARVKNVIAYHRYLGRCVSPRMRRNTFAYIFAGISPTKADIANIERHDFRLALLSMANSGETSEERVCALSLLTEMTLQEDAAARTAQAL